VDRAGFRRVEFACVHLIRSGGSVRKSAQTKRIKGGVEYNALKPPKRGKQSIEQKETENKKGRCYSLNEDFGRKPKKLLPLWGERRGSAWSAEGLWENSVAHEYSPAGVRRIERSWGFAKGVEQELTNQKKKWGGEKRNENPWFAPMELKRIGLVKKDGLHVHPPPQRLKKAMLGKCTNRWSLETLLNRGFGGKKVSGKDIGGKSWKNS